MLLRAAKLDIMPIFVAAFVLSSICLVSEPAHAGIFSCLKALLGNQQDDSSTLKAGDLIMASISDPSGDYAAPSAMIVLESNNFITLRDKFEATLSLHIAQLHNLVHATYGDLVKIDHGGLFAPVGILQTFENRTLDKTHVKVGNHHVWLKNIREITVAKTGAHITVILFDREIVTGILEPRTSNDAIVISGRSVKLDDLKDLALASP
jgi:hypothetical protein